MEAILRLGEGRSNKLGEECWRWNNMKEGEGGSEEEVHGRVGHDGGYSIRGVCSEDECSERDDPLW